MRILYFSQIPTSLGGIEVYLANLVKKIDKKKIQPIIVVEIERSHFYLCSSKSTNRLTKIKKLGLKQIIRYIQISDIIHIQAFGYFSSILFLLLSKLFNKKVITTLHGGLQNIPMNLMGFYEKIKTIVAFSIRNLLGKILIDFSDACLSVSKTDLLNVNSFLKCHRKKNNFWLPNAVHIDNSYPIPTEKRDAIIFVGRLSILKGFDLFIKIIKKIKDEIPDSTIIVIGEGILKNLIDQNPQLNIEYHQYVKPENIGTYYLRSKILLVTSLTEGFPTIILEAMKFGCVVVSTDVGGIPEMIDSEQNGYLYNISNYETVHKKIIEIYKNETLYTAFSRKAYEKVCKNFNWNVVIKKLYQIYQKIL